MSEEFTYKAAGVDIKEAAELVGDINQLRQRTEGTRKLMQSFGLFAATYDLSDYKEPVIMTGCDGVGTKMEVLLEVDELEIAGKDLVAMNVNDILTTGGDPLMFLDYVGVGRIDKSKIKRLIAGMSEHLESCNCILAGGETAEMPGVVPDGMIELSGFAVGACEKSNLIDPTTVSVGDVLIGYESDGFHANGWSLIRKILAAKAGEVSGEEMPALLAPTRLYHDAVDSLRSAGAEIRAMAHITGGGLPENLERLLGEKGAAISIPRWELGAIPKILQHVEDQEAVNTFNMGWGWVAIVPASDADKAIAAHPRAKALGEVTNTGEVQVEIAEGRPRVMSDSLKHECGLAFVRLKHDLSYYHKKYGTCLWGFQRLYLLMEKQHNRGQDGIGIGCCKLNMPIGQAYLFRERSAERDSLIKVMESRIGKFKKLERKGIIDPEADDYPAQVKEHFKFGGEVLLGHLRYGTSGAFGEGGCHPFVRRTNWPTKSLMVAGNFNMTNARDLNHHLINRGQHPVFATDTQTVLEEIGYHLDVAHDWIYRRERDKKTPGKEIPGIIADELDMNLIMQECGSIWDGGYTIGGVVGNGDAFVLRDPCGIRPCSYYEDDEVIAFASERAPLMTVFSCDANDVKELPPGNVAVIKHRHKTSECEMSIKPFCESREVKSCSFERIYFSRPNDPEIYQERKALGAAMLPQIIKSIDDDLANTVFSFVPNTAEIAYHGMMASLREFRRGQVRDSLIEAQKAGTLNEHIIDELIMRNWPRAEKIAHKDIKLRTFISQEKGRDQMVSHVYDISYGVVKAGEDNLVVMDDSIVRGTTLRKSILTILARTKPKKIVIVSTAPQIRYPDCYGIDMSELGKFIAFQAAIRVLTKKNQQSLVHDVHQACLIELTKPDHEMVNAMKMLYAPITADEISAEISLMVRPSDIEWKGEIEVIYQTIENLHEAIPLHKGDWYFTGNYPTPGGNRVANQSLVSHLEGDSTRPYDMLL